MQASKFEILTRAGFAARGLLYLLIGFIALKTGRNAGTGAALEYIDSGAGKLLVAAMALGFLGYGIWRMSEALLDTEGNGGDFKGAAVRTGGFISGLIHLGLALYAARLSFGTSGGGAQGGAEQGAETALSLPGGQTLLAVAAILLLATGLYQLVKAIKLGFLRHIDQRAAGQAWVRWAGRLGYAARGAVFIVVAWFLWNAGREANADQAGGTGDALGLLPPTLQSIVASGLILFGLFSLVEARYRRITDPHVLDRLGSAGPRSAPTGN